MNYDLIVIGGGTAGVSAAYTAAERGVKALLIEKSDVLGGAITRGLVVPVMKTDTENINTDFVSDLKIFADKYNARHAFFDGNEFWFNPELLKIVFDDMLKSAGCSVLFSSEPQKIKYNNGIFEHFIRHKLQKFRFTSKYIIDASAEGIAFKLLNCAFQEKSEKRQMPSLRFIVSGIDIKAFADWLENFDTDRNVTVIERAEKQIYLSTACTWDKNRKWALAPLFERAVKDGILEKEDTAYFQVFSMPSMPDALNFNAPRILLEENERLDNPFVYSKALVQGRERIFRLYNFCRKYLKGFENSYISHISDILGVREYTRAKCRYTVTLDDLINPKKFQNAAFACSYPVDVHSNKSDKDTLRHINHTYYIPLDALISKNYDNLYAAGRIISADFEAHSALRTQLSCFAAGEAAAKDIAAKLKL